MEGAIPMLRGALIAAQVVCIICSQGRLAAGEKRAGDEPAHRDGFETYARIETLYRNWDRGLFGSRRFHRRELYALLLESLGKTISTNHDYVLFYPELQYDKVFRCTLSCGNWLWIVGTVDAESLKALAGDGSSPPSTWWRTGRLVSISGRIVKFSLRDSSPRRVVLHLEGIRLLPLPAR